MKKNDLREVNNLISQLAMAENDLRMVNEGMSKKGDEFLLSDSFGIPSSMVHYAPHNEFGEFIIPYIKKNINKLKEELHKFGIEDA